jgi:malonate transporter and related proteins
MFERIVGPLLPVAFVIALGYIAGKRRRLSQADSLLISRLVLTWIFPSLLLIGMANTPRAQILDYRFIAATFVGVMGMFLLVLALGRWHHRKLDSATIKALVCGYPDAAFMGIPILQSMFGAGSIYSVLVLNIIAALVMMPLTTMLLTLTQGKQSGGAAFMGSLRQSLGKPLVWAPALGIAVSLLGIKVPPVLASSLDLLGKATPGVSLLCLGLIMSSVKLTMSREVVANLGLKLIAQPLLMYGATILFAVKGEFAHQMILLCALPSATISAMFANEAGVYRSEAATSILVGTVLSVVTFSIAIALTSS